jgi:hypothetical protein
MDLPFDFGIGACWLVIAEDRSCRLTQIGSSYLILIAIGGVHCGNVVFGLIGAFIFRLFVIAVKLGYFGDFRPPRRNAFGKAENYV